MDRAIEFFSPEKGLERYRAKAQLALADSWIGASTSRRSMSEWKPSKGDADGDTLQALDNLRVRSRDLARNNGLACGALAGQVTSIIGTGLSVQPEINAKILGISDEQATDWQYRAAQEFEMFACNRYCDVRRQQNFYEMQELAFRSVLESGDIFCLRVYEESINQPFATRLQLIEADRISNPGSKQDDAMLAGGVQKNANGEPIYYHVCNRHPYDYKSKENKTWRAIKAYADDNYTQNILHVYRILRPGQTRGVPILSPVLESFKQLGRYTEAELMAAVIAGMFTVFVKSEAGDAGIADPQLESDPSSPDYKLGNGAIIGLAPGEDITTTNPGRPNALFEPFVNSIVRQIGVALEEPYEVLIKHFDSSYSAARAALLAAWRMYKCRRAWFAGAFCQPVYEFVISESIAQGRLEAPGFFDDPIIRYAYLGAQWVGDAPGQIDPLKEVNAQEKRIQLGISTIQRETIETNGGDWEKNHKQRAKEVAYRKKDGVDDLSGQKQNDSMQPDQPQDPEQELD